MKAKSHHDIITFIRSRDYKFLRELGKGACGVTVLLHDDLINEHFVCKKFTPYDENERPTLFANFVRETKILHQVFHENIVRVFNYYLYPDKFTGFILMEFVDGDTIEKYLDEHPEMINEIFLQTINGFRYLEENNILHRDIRPANLMVRDDGKLKIIDFGFGKQVLDEEDFDKSVSLNWWCELPNEFSDKLYDFRTEVYFVGKLFEGFIRKSNIDHFKYTMMLNKMCERDPSLRIQRFGDVKKTIQNDMFLQIDFDTDEMACYRSFSQSMEKHITKIEMKAEYIEDVDSVIADLENAYRNFMLEATVPDSSIVTKCFLGGPYHYRKTGFDVQLVKNFLHMMKSFSSEKKQIVLSNLHTRLDAITRYDHINDDIPF